MANSVPIPQDIIDSIIEAVGNDRCFLKTCALVSSSFLLPSRKHLFSRISLRNDQACQRLYQLLVKNPVIQSFVRSIVVTGYNEFFKSHSLIDILRLSFCCLKSLSIIKGWCLNWNDFSSELKDALSTLIHLPTLKALYIEGVSMPAIFFHGIHLTKLELRSLVPVNDFDSKQSRLLTSAASEGVTTTVSHTVVDQCVWRFHVPERGPTEPIFLPFMSRLRVFEIRATAHAGVAISNLEILSFLMRSLRLSLTSPATLKQLKFDIVFMGDDIDFNYNSGFYDDLRDADVWSHLDSIITHPTGSRLQRVDINIALHYDEDWMGPNEIEVVQPVLDALPLLREKGILFVETDLLDRHRQ